MFWIKFVHFKKMKTICLPEKTTGLGGKGSLRMPSHPPASTCAPYTAPIRKHALQHQLSSWTLVQPSSPQSLISARNPVALSTWSWNGTRSTWISGDGAFGLSGAYAALPQQTNPSFHSATRLFSCLNRESKWMLVTLTFSQSTMQSQ